MENYDVSIVGGGPGAMTSAVYCSRKGLKTLLIDSPEVMGDNLENLKLVHRLKSQALEFGTDIIKCDAHALWYRENSKIIYTSEGQIDSKAIILATGLSPKKLGVPLESMFYGCGLHYYNSATASYLKDRVVVVYGKSDEAASLAITLSALCNKVYLVCCAGALSCAAEKVEVIKSTPNIVLLPHTLIYRIEHHNRRIEGVGIIDKTTGNTGTLDCQLIYVSKGYEPSSNLSFPYTLTESDGVFKVEICSPKDAIMAATDGAIAAISAIKYIESLSL